MDPSKSTWEMIGSLATAAAVLVALVAFLAERYASRQERDRQRAEQLRQNLQRAVDASHSLSVLLNSGDALIVAASAIASQFAPAPGATMRPSDFWNSLSNGGMCLLAAETGWYSSTVTSGLNQRLSDLEEASLTLTGQMTMVADAASMFRGIVADAHSPKAFRNVLVLETDPKFSFVKDNKNEQDVQRLVRLLAVDLMGNTAAYYAARYEKAVQLLAEFIATSSTSFMKLDDERLIGISATRPKGGTTSTYTGDMRAILSDLKDTLRQDTYGELSKMVDQIEKLTSKESAEHQLHALPLKNK